MRMKHGSITLILIQLFVFSAMVGALPPTVSATQNDADTTTSNPDFPELHATEDTGFDWFDGADDLEPEFVPGEVLVKFRTSISTGLINGIATTGIGSIDELNERFQAKEITKVLSNVYKLTLPKDADVLSVVREYEVDPNVEYAEPNGIYHAFFVPDDPHWNITWGPKKIEADWAWNTTTGNPSVLVAVLDSGINYNHPDLAANYVNLGYDWINDDCDPIDDGTPRHGTHCAGIIAAVINNGKGIAGLAQVQIMAEKVLDEQGYGDWEDIASGIQHAVSQGANIISMSLGYYDYSETVHTAVKEAYNADVLLVAAAGNERWTLKEYPAALEEVIAVAATDESDNPADWWPDGTDPILGRIDKGSAFGDWIELAAPGDEIYSTGGFSPGGYSYMSGTSMAAPHVAGVAALIWSQFPNMGGGAVRYQLRKTADDLGEPGFDIYYGYGRINARKAVEQAPPDHDLLVMNWKLPFASEPSDEVTVDTTVVNFGTKNESNIMVQLLFNGTAEDSVQITSLPSGKSTTVSCSWSPNLVLNGGFETGDSSHWVTGGAGDHVVTSEDSYSGAYSMLIGYKYSLNVANARDWCYQTITIPATATNAQLSFYYHLFTEDYEPFDWFEVYIRDSSGNNLEKVFYKAGTKAGLEEFGWEQVTYDLSAYAGQTIQLYFAVANWYDTAYKTWCYIDDVSVTVPELEEVYNITTYVNPVRFETETKNNKQSALTWVRQGKAVRVPGDFGTIKGAIETTNLGIYGGDATIRVAPGTYNEYDLTIQNMLTSLALVGEDRSTTIIDSAGQGYAGVWIHADNVIITGFTILNISERGGGIRLLGANNPTISDNTILNTRISATYGIYVDSLSRNTVISDNTISKDSAYYGARYGIVLLNSSGQLISNNDVLYSGGYGIYLFYSNNNTISANIITDNNYYGVKFTGGNDNTIVRNTIRNSDKGICFAYSSNNVIYHNNFIDNTVQLEYSGSSNTWDDGEGRGNYWSDYTGVDTDGDGIGDTNLPWQGVDYYPLMGPLFRVPQDSPTIQGAINAVDDGTLILVSSGTYYENVVVDKPLMLIGEDPSTTTIVGGKGGMFGEDVVTIKFGMVTIHGFTIQNGRYGIYPCFPCLFGSMISGNTISNNWIGVYLNQDTEDNTVSNNVVSNNDFEGILVEFSDGNTVSSNILLNNDGIAIVGSDGNTVSDNIVSGGGDIYLEMSSGNTVTGNIVTNSFIGIYPYRSSGNSFIGNTMLDNSYGVYLVDSSDNIIHHNNFINNTVQALLSWTSSNNTWIATNHVGNYWSNYNGEDNNPYYGIGDTPYVIDENNQDNYPLMWRWFPGDINGDGILTQADIDLWKATWGTHDGDPDYNPIADLNYDGVINLDDLFILIQNSWRDVAVVSVTAPPTASVGDLVPIDAEVKNEGAHSEIFYVTAYYDSAVIGTQTVGLCSGDETTLTFTWDTTGVSPGPYTIKAVASTVLGETDTADNTKIDGTVTITA